MAANLPLNSQNPGGVGADRVKQGSGGDAQQPGLSPEVQKALNVLNRQPSAGAQQAGGATPASAVDRLVDGAPKLTPRQEAAALKQTHQYVETVPETGKPGLKSGSLMGLLDTVFLSAKGPTNLGNAAGRKELGAVADEAMTALRSHVQLKDASGKPILLDTTRAQSLVGNLMLLAQGKHPDSAKKASTGDWQSLLGNAVMQLMPGSSSKYRALVGGVISLRGSGNLEVAPGAVASTKDINKAFWNDQLTHGVKLIQYEPSRFVGSGDSDLIEPKQQDVVNDLRKMYTTAMVYANSGLVHGPQKAQVEHMAQKYLDKLNSLPGAGAHSSPGAGLTRGMAKTIGSPGLYSGASTSLPSHLTGELQIKPVNEEGTPVVGSAERTDG